MSHMNRRKFMKHIGAASTAPFILNGFSFNLLAANSPLMQMLQKSNSDRVLVFIQLHGGNDGLNTIIPVKRYSEYYNVRPNIAIPDDGSRKYIPLDESLPEDDQLGLHPDMTGIKELYDQQKAAIVQAVGYDNMNLSHFRSRDIWFMGGDYDEQIPSGWMGRFLDQEYPGYPDTYPNDTMQDPLGLELGNAVSLAFQRENSIPAGISLLNPQAFYDLINSVGIDPPPSQSFPDSYYGDELAYLTDFEKKSNEYALRLKEVYDAGTNAATINYPTSYPLNAPAPYINNPLSEQLKIIARLLSGGIQTRIFLVRIGGFDTHADQVESYETSMGRHAALLYHVSSSVKAFMDDLIQQGLDEKVLAMTFSEFGRRVASNGSYGTDHGKAAPILLFGSGLKGGVYGTNPDFSDLDGGNLKHQFDYRQVYTTVLSDWLGSPDSSLIDTGFGDYLSQKLDLIATSVAVHDLEGPVGKNILFVCFPNPAKDHTTISYFIEKGEHVRIEMYSSSGQLLKILTDQKQASGHHKLELDISEFESGSYIYRIRAGDFKSAKTMIIQ